MKNHSFFFGKSTFSSKWDKNFFGNNKIP